MINNVVLLGRLTADPELKKTQSDLSVCSFTIANDTGSGEHKKTHFLPVVAWRGTAEFICKYFKKGQQIGIVGQLTMRKWEDKDGKSHNAYEVLANEAHFIEPKRDGDDAPKAAAPTPTSAPAQTEGFAEIDDDYHLPF